jgi:C4-dicarboxylate-specific signal transduction histidine kinase
MSLQAFKRMTAKSLLPAGAIALAAIIFVADTFTDLVVAIPAFYTAVVLLSVRFCERRGVVLVAAGCIALTVISDFLTPDVAVSEAGILNTVIGIAAIVTTALLAVKIEAATAEAYEARSQLAHIGRVAILGELTASIAHEVNQPLAAAVANGNACLRWLAGEPPNLEEARRAIESIVKDANRASGIIARLRAMTQRAPAKMTPVDINEIIRDTVALSQGELKDNHIIVQLDLSDEMPKLKGDAVQLQQVLLNTILNAVDAIDAAATGPRQLSISSKFEAKSSVLISVRDSGIGLRKDQFERLFEPFYTDKANGMGMGLAISRSIVEAHDGKIWAEANASRGAVFHFRLPLEHD